MGDLKGVGDVAFDCKTATIRMQGDATLDRATVAKALASAGCQIGEFTAGERPTFLVVTATLVRIDGAGAAGVGTGTSIPDAPSAASLERDLPRDLPALTDVFMEPDGHATLLVRADQAIDAEALKAALARRQLAAEGFATKRWPTTAARRIATVKGIGARTPDHPPEATTQTVPTRPDPRTAHARARAAIEGIKNVLAAIPRRDGESFVVFTQEPCANLETRLGEALRAAGLELAAIE